MRNWKSLTREERKAERDKVPGEYARKQFMDANLAATLDLLKDNSSPRRRHGRWPMAATSSTPRRRSPPTAGRRLTGRTEPAGATAAKCERS